MQCHIETFGNFLEAHAVADKLSNRNGAAKHQIGRNPLQVHIRAVGTENYPFPMQMSLPDSSILSLSEV